MMAISRAKPYRFDRRVLIANGLWLTPFVAYVALRLLAWRRVVLLEDTDSLQYLRDIQTFLRLDLSAITSLGPDNNLFYPFFGALFSLPGWSPETGARIASLAFSLLLFGAVYAFGRRFLPSAALAAGLALIAFNPALVGHAFAVLTEPSYVAVVYLGLWLFWAQRETPTPASAALVAVVFGMAFLNRLEGLLFLFFIPFIQVAYLLWWHPQRYRVGKVLSWTLVYAAVFVMLMLPQVWRVSNVMGTFALNGRQVWSLLLQQPDGRSYQEKIYGLDYSPSVVNIDYLQKNPSELAGAVRENLLDQLGSYGVTVASNLNQLYVDRLPNDVGILPLVLFVFGLVALYRTGRRFELLFIVSFLGVGLAAPLLHNVVTRHILVVIPMILLVAGLGAVYLGRLLTEGLSDRPVLTNSLPVALVLVTLLAWAFPFKALLDPPTNNGEYSPAELVRPIEVLSTTTQDLGLEQAPVVAARKSYLAYYSGSERLPLPFTDYMGLIRYLELNGAHFLYLHHGMLEGADYPFLERFRSGTTEPDFRLLHSGETEQGEAVELYLLRRSTYRTGLAP